MAPARTSGFQRHRFLDRLGQEPHRAHLHALFNALIQRLGSVVPDLGRDTAGDATALNARRKRDHRAQAERDAGLPQASGGRKEYADDQGNVTRAIEWFGFKLHLLAANETKQDALVANPYGMTRRVRADILAAGLR